MSEIQLRGVRVHNLKSVDLDLPYGKLIVFCGISGSGKSSLAMDTLYAEGQRRYIESFSAYTRQFLEKLEKPEADQIEGIPPAAAVTAKTQNHLSRSTIGTSTETIDYLRLLFSKIGTMFCRNCGREVRLDSPESILAHLKSIHANRNNESLKIIIAFEPPGDDFAQSLDEFQSQYRETGILRGSVFGRSFRLDEGGITPEEYENIQNTLGLVHENKTSEHGKNEDLFGDDDFYDPDNDENENGDEHGLEIETASRIKDEIDDEPDSELDDSKAVSMFVSSDECDEVGCLCKSTEIAAEDEPHVNCPAGPPPILFFVDRLVIGKTDEVRICDSIETALKLGDEHCRILLDHDETNSATINVDDNVYDLVGFTRTLSCEDCRISYPRMEPKLFSFNSPMGACPACEGFGNLVTFDLDLIIPNKSRNIRDGAIAPWNSPSYKSRLTELLDKAEELGIPTDVPFENLTPAQRKIIYYGSEKDKFEGLSRFFDKLQKQKYKMHIRVFLSRWRSYRKCPSCNGTRLRKDALAVKIGNETNMKNIAEICSMEIRDALLFFEKTQWTARELELGHTPLAQAVHRLRYMNQVGLGYLTLDRAMRTLSGGEQRRISLTSALGSSLVDMLYVLDEPSIGLHPTDTDLLMESIASLRDRGNTVVVVEHEESILRAADLIVEVGPEAGQGGGKIVFCGTPQDMQNSETSLTGSYLSGKRCGGTSGCKRRKIEHGMIELFGASGNNLKNIDVAFPMGMLCLITGVSGAGKSSLIQETLYPALLRKLGVENVPPGLPWTQLLGAGQIDDVVMVDQSSIGRSPRSNPVTYLKIFDEIRGVFAETPDAKVKNFGAGHFSFNVDGGRCDTCKGDGYISIDMQFMADMYVKCPQCHGKRYQREVLEIQYRNKNIADVLEMTAREAFGFFRGQAKVQKKLKRLMDVGLDYIRLGQPANTLSGGESQRLKLATYLSSMKKGRCLFLLDEPTTGLHFSDIVQLLDCFDALIETGHSMIVVEHNLQMMRAADYIIDLGPGAAEEGGRIVAQGTPEEVAKCTESKTGRLLV